jgi:outer membrane protein
MMDRITAKAVAVILCGALVTAPAAAQNQNPAPGAQPPGPQNTAPPASQNSPPAQNPASNPPSPQAPPDRAPSVSYARGFLGAYSAGAVSQTPFTDSRRIHDLIRAGNLYLSVQDAVALALENNLDIELERYGVSEAATDTLRAKGGGTLRGVPLTVNEVPAGLGGPGSPLVVSAATGITPQTTVPVNVTDQQLTVETQGSLNVTGTFPFASGPLIPQYDPAVTGTFLAQHETTPETNTAVAGAQTLVSNNYEGNAGYTQGFSTGTQIVAGFNNLYTNQNSIRNAFNPFYSSSLGVTVTQPLLRGFGVQMNRRFIRIAKNSEKISDYVFEQQVISTVYGVIRLYDDLVSLDEDLNVKRETLATAQRLYEDNRNKVEQGTLAPVELTRAQAQVAAALQDLANSDGYAREQELILKNVLSRDFSSDPAVRDARIIPTDPLVIEPLPTQSPEELRQLAIRNRPEFQAANLQVVNAQINIEGTRNELKPELDIVANASNAALAGSLNSTYVPAAGAPPLTPNLYPGLGGGYGTTLAQIFDRDFPTYSIGLNLTLPIRNRIAQSDLARDELQLRQSQVRTKQVQNQILVEVQDALIALTRTTAAYQAALEARKLQEQSLEIEQERFNVGLSTNFLVIQYQSFVAQARSTEVAALGAYAKAKLQLERATGVTLPDHNISIDEAFRGQVSRTSTPNIPAGVNPATAAPSTTNPPR